MRVIKIKAGDRPKWVWIDNTLETLQKQVGGYIEAVTLFTDVAIICDEEGRIKGKPYNCTICGYDFVGDLLIVGVDGEEFTDCPLHVMQMIFGNGME